MFDTSQSLMSIRFAAAQTISLKLITRIQEQRLGGAIVLDEQPVIA